MTTPRELQPVMPDRCDRRIIRLGMPRCILVAGHKQQKCLWDDGRDDAGNRYGAMPALFGFSVNEPRTKYGNEVPPAQACIEPETACREAISAAVERWGTAAVVDAIAPDPKTVKAITGPRVAFAFLKNLRRLKRERLVAIYLDAQNKMIGDVVVVSVGTLNTTRTHPREVLQPAIERAALGFILAHNHPSGNLTPSKDDVAFTRAIQKATEFMGIELYDHLIVSSCGFVSLREKGLM